MKTFIRDQISAQPIPNPTPTLPLLQIPTRHQIPKMLLQVISAGLSQFHRISYRHTPMAMRKHHSYLAASLAVQPANTQ